VSSFPVWIADLGNYQVVTVLVQLKIQKYLNTLRDQAQAHSTLAFIVGDSKCPRRDRFWLPHWDSRFTRQPITNAVHRAWKVVKAVMGQVKEDLSTEPGTL